MAERYRYTEVADRHRRQGYNYEDSYKDSEALFEYDAAIRADPDGEDAYINKGRLLYKLGRHQEALRVLDQVIRTHPNVNSTAFSNKGEVLEKLGAHDEAMQALDKASRLEKFPITATLRALRLSPKGQAERQERERYDRSSILQADMKKREKEIEQQKSRWNPIWHSRSQPNQIVGQRPSTPAALSSPGLRSPEPMPGQKNAVGQREVTPPPKTEPTDAQKAAAQWQHDEKIRNGQISMPPDYRPPWNRDTNTPMGSMMMPGGGHFFPGHPQTLGDGGRPIKPPFLGPGKY